MYALSLDVLSSNSFLFLDPKENCDTSIDSKFGTSSIISDQASMYMYVLVSFSAVATFLWNSSFK